MNPPRLDMKTAPGRNLDAVFNDKYFVEEQ